MTKIYNFSRRKLAVIAGLLMVIMAFTNAGAQTPVTIGTTAVFTNINGSGQITFNFENTNPYGVIITDIEGVTGAAGLQTCEVWYKPTALTALPGAVSAATGWTLAMSGTYTGVTNTTTTVTQPFITGGTFVVPAMTTYAFSIASVSQRYYSIPAATPATAFGTGGGCNMVFSSTYSYGGGVPPAAPSNPSRGWIGKITFKAATIYANNTAISALTSPFNFCAGAQDIKVRLRNGGSTIVNNVDVKWTLDGVLQAPISWTFPLDSIGGTGVKDTVLTLMNYAFAPNVPHVIRAWTTLPNGVADGFPDDDTLTVNVRPSLNGLMTVGGIGASYPTLTALATDLNTFGICGPVTVNVNPGTYTGKFAVNNVAGVSSTNTISIIGADKTTCLITDSIGDALVSFTNTSYVTFKNFTVTNKFTTLCTGINIVGASATKGSNSTISNCIVNIPNTGTATSYGIFATGGANGISATSIDSITLDSNVVNGGYYGMGIYGSSNALANRGNVIRFNTVNNIWLYGIYFAYNYNPIQTLYNTVNMNPANTSTGYGLTVYYNQNSSATQSSLTIGNRVTNASYMGYYIYYNTTTATAPHKIYNNTLSGSMKYSTNYGMYLYTATGATNMFEVYHNSFVVNGYAASQYVFYYYNSTSISGVRVKNNVFGLTSLTGTGATNAFPAYFNSNPVGNVSNYNAYFNSVGVNLVYRGGNFTKATYRIATAGGDSSYNKNPYINNTFNLLDGCNTGVDLTASVPTDIIGSTRTITPTAGAFEYFTSANDMAIDSLLLPLNASLLAPQDLKVRIRNVGNVPASSFNVSYKLNTGAIVTQAWSGSPINSCDTATVTFTGADQITFAMGQSDLKVFTSAPNAGVDANKVNDTIGVTYYNYLPLSGSYTIGGISADFVTLNDATLMLQRAGISGPVEFTLNAGTYTGPVILSGIAGVSAINTITFDGVNAATRIITSSADATFMVNQVSYVTLKNLTVVNTATTTVSGIALVGNATNTSGKGFTVKNCVVNIPNSGTGTSYGIIVTGNMFGTADANQWTDSVTIDSNTINGGYYGIQISTSASGNATYNRGHRVRYNTINNAYYYGMRLYYLYNPVEILYNKITMNPINVSSYGIYYYYCQNSSTTIPSKVIGNNVTAGYTALYNYYTNAGTTLPTQIWNNILVTNGSCYTSLYCVNAAAATVSVCHNTVVATKAGTYGGMYFATMTAAGTVVKNNIFSINGGTAAYFGSSPTGNFTNYNNYYNTGGPALVYRTATTYTESNFSTAANGGDSSFSQDPLFVSTTNFHSNNSCTKGVDLTAIIPSDLDGNSRPLPPSIGAYEATPLANDVKVDKVVYSAPILPGLQDVSVRVKNASSNVATSFNVSYKLNGGTAVTMPWSGTMLGCGDTAWVTFTGVQQMNLPVGANTLKVYTSDPNGFIDNNRNNDTTMVALSTISKVAGNALIANATPGNPAGSSIRFASRPEMIGNATTAFTVETWVKLTTNTVDQKFVSKSNVNNGFCIGILTAGAKFDPEIWTVANGTGSLRMTTTGVSLPNNTIPANKWTHVAVTWQSGVGVKAYINGSLCGYLNSTTATTISQSAADLLLGTNSWDFGYATSGAIDEVRLWNVALDSLTLRRNMHRTLSGTESGLTTYIQLNEGVSSTIFGDAVGGAIGYRNAAAVIAPATMPLGGDSSLTMPATLSGTFYNGDMTLNVYDPFDNACDLTLTEINNAPNVQPTATHVYPFKYWVVQPFGNPGSFLADLTLNFPFGQLNVTDPDLRLYKRDYNADGAWAFYRTSASIASTSVIFTAIDTFGQFTVASNGTSPLPVSLLSFGGKRTNDVVKLDWVTASEINSRGFEVQRSYNASEAFETIGEVKSIGNNKGTKSSYNYTDKQADLNQTIYYRLKQMDMDGKYSYSPVVVINAAEGTETTTVYPNPFSNEFSVRVHSGADANAVVRIVDITGKEMYMKSHTVQSGSSNITIDGAALKAGLYFVTIELNGVKQTVKLNKQ